MIVQHYMILFNLFMKYMAEILLMWCYADVKLSSSGDLFDRCLTPYGRFTGCKRPDHLV